MVFIFVDFTVINKYINLYQNKLGDIIEIGVEVISFGRTSITLKVDVRNKDTENSILKVDKIVFVSVDNDGLPIPHNKIEIKH